MFSHTKAGVVTYNWATNMPKFEAAAAAFEPPTRIAPRLAKLRAGLDIPGRYQPGFAGIWVVHSLPNAITVLPLAVHAPVVVLRLPPMVRKLSSVVQLWLPAGANVDCGPGPWMKTPPGQPPIVT